MDPGGGSPLCFRGLVPGPAWDPIASGPSPLLGAGRRGGSGQGGQSRGGWSCQGALRPPLEEPALPGCGATRPGTCPLPLLPLRARAALPVLGVCLTERGRGEHEGGLGGGGGRAAGGDAPVDGAVGPTAGGDAAPRAVACVVDNFPRPEAPPVVGADTGCGEQSAQGLGAGAQAGPRDPRGEGGCPPLTVRVVGALHAAHGAHTGDGKTDVQSEGTGPAPARGWPQPQRSRPLREPFQSTTRGGGSEHGQILRGLLSRESVPWILGQRQGSAPFPPPAFTPRPPTVILQRGSSLLDPTGNAGWGTPWALLEGGGVRPSPGAVGWGRVPPCSRLLGAGPAAHQEWQFSSEGTVEPGR